MAGSGGNQRSVLFKTESKVVFNPLLRTHASRYTLTAFPNISPSFFVIRSNSSQQF
jgi:hypothetical protein